MKKNLVLITVTGQDHPGITARLMKCVMASNSKIEDLGQSITHGLYTYPLSKKCILHVLRIKILKKMWRFRAYS